MFETTLAGSLPKPSWLATPNVLWAPWTLSGQPLFELGVIQARRHRPDDPRDAPGQRGRGRRALRQLTRAVPRGGRSPTRSRR